MIVKPNHRATLSVKPLSAFLLYKPFTVPRCLHAYKIGPIKYALNGEWFHSFYQFQQGVENENGHTVVLSVFVIWARIRSSSQHVNQFAQLVQYIVTHMFHVADCWTLVNTVGEVSKKYVMYDFLYFMLV